mmetsp:Transcript_39969/g.58769  ORF Transcript_39969/g.58769 Transcript_39969/m.58769 type:complete len:246 (+) Transcript_39969:61-798(+)|eukprot:CAMPEP_0195527300 /NCGR_PEP_ID=MMETSP0794_2-20130614/28863_1 /TAXON_ID=515487 /ORGANISM="Stephanopyxis turris, Strain CCMP 815" /LENGTH=245 /DNA_ID=CAMNT_0040658181 /DNA_START=61 /DNA_END=798 /DNA_ORIENTATION=-
MNERHSLVAGGSGAPTTERNIIYSVIARGTVILVEETLNKSGRKIAGNFATITNKLLPRFPETDGKASFIYDQYMFHLIRKDRFKYLCMSDRDAKRRITFAFLGEVMQTFVERFGENMATANAYGMNADFAPTLQELMQKYNDPAQDKISEAHKKVADVKSIMIENIDKVLLRGEKMEILVDRANNLKENTQEFKFESNQLRKRMCRKHAKWIAILVGIVVVIILIIVISVVVNNSSSSSRRLLM